jgi:hypothetical protein
VIWLFCRMDALDSSFVQTLMPYLQHSDADVQTAAVQVFRVRFSFDPLTFLSMSTL